MSVTVPKASRLDDRVVVITGASSGVGRAAAHALSELGATVAVVGRNPARTRQVAAEVGGTAYIADFTDLSAVRGLAASLLDDLPRIHVLANNAGGTFRDRTLTRDGYDITFQSNHLAPFLLTNLLLPRLLETAGDSPAGTVRVIQTSSDGNRFGRVRLDALDNRTGLWAAGMRPYGTSKLENILFTRELAKRLRGTGVSTYAFHPGFVATNFGGGGPVIKAMQKVALSPAQGAEPLVRLAGATTVPAPSGNYFDRLTAPGKVNPQANDAELARGLWEASERLAGVAAGV
ncbi:SDR family NAD(P)-dependent oxidoreductase [Frondihabitans cladoniiphilus]|uniref:Oxidoreductase n=1 Tax=Frondihabitans cladoniiphilus TaxID=715785 RepID=A0ABP8VPW1_9MICO